jgi:hypothetical protein
LVKIKNLQHYFFFELFVGLNLFAGAVGLIFLPFWRFHLFLSFLHFWKHCIQLEGDWPIEDGIKRVTAGELSRANLLTKYASSLHGWNLEHPHRCRLSKLFFYATSSN